MTAKVSDLIAEALAERGIARAFGISGAGNLHLFDSIARRGATDLVCTHHEQAAAMAAHGHHFATGHPAAAVFTTGGGAANGFTGVLGAFMDSVPMIVLSGNENSKYTRPDNPLRIYGVQGFDVVSAVRGITKYAARLMDPTRVRYELDKLFYLATKGRPGPVWLDVPMNVQSAQVDPAKLAVFDPATDPEAVAHDAALAPAFPADKLDAIIAGLRSATRPVVWLGQGVRLAHAQHLLPELLRLLRVPYLTSWSGNDLIDSGHPLAFGRAGVYGHRCGNFVLQNADFLLAVGTRLAVPQVGYDITEFVRAGKVAVVDVDRDELAKYRERYDIPVQADAGVFLTALLDRLRAAELSAPAAWFAQCDRWRSTYPTVGPEHADADGYINGYRLMRHIEKALKPDQVIVTDAGTAAMATFAVLRVKPPQRLGYSMGLGEMGWGLPAAVGASFATNRGEVLCINCDGSMMLNLQELQTIAHHKLPVKILVISNEGYLSIKLSQRNLFEGRLAGSHPASGVSCPRFSGIAAAFGMASFEARTYDEVDAVLPKVLAHDGPCICEIFTHPDQPFVPKLGVALGPDGVLVSPPLEDLGPMLPRDELRQNMLIGIHPKSERIG